MSATWSGRPSPRPGGPGRADGCRSPTGTGLGPPEGSHCGGVGVGRSVSPVIAGSSVGGDAGAGLRVVDHWVTVSGTVGVLGAGLGKALGMGAAIGRGVDRGFAFADTLPFDAGAGPPPDAAHLSANSTVHLNVPSDPR